MIDNLRSNLEILNTRFTEKDLTITLTNGDTIIFDAIGDCCSSSFIEDCDNLEALQNTILFGIEEVGNAKESVWSDDEYTLNQWVFYKFKTSKGIATFSLRNESNGYYNGSLEVTSLNRETYFKRPWEK